LKEESPSRRKKKDINILVTYWFIQPMHPILHKCKKSLDRSIEECYIFKKRRSDVEDESRLKMIIKVKVEELFALMVCVVFIYFLIFF
jgi:hypothetical protein